MRRATIFNLMFVLPILFSMMFLNELVAQSPDPEAPFPTDQEFLRYATIPSPTIAQRWTERFPEIDRVIYWVNIVNDDSGDTEGIVLDESRTPVDPNPLRIQERQEYDRRYGKLEKRLHQHLEELPGSTEVGVTIWIKHTPRDIDRSLALTNPAAYDAAVLSEQLRLDSTLTEAELDIQGILGQVSLHKQTAGPVIRALLLKDQLLLLNVADIDCIDRIYKSDDDEMNDLATAEAIANWDENPTMDGDPASTLGSVGVLESRRPDNYEPLAIADTFDPNQPVPDPHSTLVTAIIRNIAANPPNGFAKAATIYMANGGTAYGFSPIDWAVNDKGCTTLNQSWHSVNEATSSDFSDRDHYLDYIVRTKAVFITTAAGNTTPAEGGDDEYVNHKGYNIMTVANVDDNGDIVTGESAGSVWRNDGKPQELPHISANGETVSVVGVTNSGTSFASPAIAGIVHGIKELNSSLTYSPEAFKAIIMASPTDPVGPDGCPHHYRKDAFGYCSLSDGRDGTGLVNGLEASVIAQSQNRKSNNIGDESPYGHDYGSMAKSNFDVTHIFNRKYYAKCSSQSGGCRIKAVIAFDSSVVCGATCLNSSKDYRLYLKGYRQSDGQYITGPEGISWNDSYQVVDFPAAGTDTYRLEIELNNYDNITTETTYFGIAWHAY